MERMSVKRFEAPDETRPYPKGRTEIVHLAAGTVGRAFFEPGWKWSESVKPIAGTDSCQVAHLVFVVAGRMHLRMDDGQEGEVGPGDVAEIPPGHDAWVVGNETCVVLDFAGMEHYAERGAAYRQPDLPPSQPGAY
jgi:mannose-6-phosphate isomerase-like protein (cupin superfamily)